MKVFTSVKDPEIARILRAGGIGVLRTDTLYGVVARADDEAAVARVYELKDRDTSKSPIVLIVSIAQLFDLPSEPVLKLVDDEWPGPTSVIIPSTKAPDWLQRGNGSVAYRLPDDENLTTMLHATGPLIAPSANPEGEPPAMNMAQAQAYFGDKVDFYVDGGEVTISAPSRLLRMNEDGEVERLR